METTTMAMLMKISKTAIKTAKTTDLTMTTTITAIKPNAVSEIDIMEAYLSF
jgi:hypothetical protein